MKKKTTSRLKGNRQHPYLDEYIEPISLPPWHGMTLIKSPSDPRSGYIATREREILLRLRQVTKFVHHVGATQSSNFQLIHKKRRGNVHRPDFRTEAKQLIHFLKIDWPDFESVLPGHVFNPYVASLIATTREFPDLENQAKIFPHLFPNEWPQFVEALHRYVDKLRERVQSAAFKDDLHTIARRCRKNYRESIKYVRSIFRHRGTRHLAIRLDLAYNMVDSHCVSVPTTISAADARKHMAAFVRYLRRKYPVTGYVWSLEYGLFRGYHFHFLIFLNGHLHQQDSIAWQLGKIWEGRITDGMGIFFNCNATTYWKRGVGMIRAEDTVKRDILEMNVLPYLTKADFLSSIKGGRWFDKGDMPTSSQTTSGRPRLTPRPRLIESTST